MKIRRCDRCGKLMEDPKEGVRFLVAYNNLLYDNQIEDDICDECYAEFLNDFMVAESSEQVQK